MTDQRPETTDRMDDEPDHGEESYVGTGRLADRVALITGGDSGIGRAVALAYAREGADVVLTYLDGEQADGERTAALVEDAGRRAVLVPGDPTSEEFCQQPVDRTVAEFGRVDIVADLRLGRVPRQQRGVPDGAARWHRRRLHRAVRPGDEDQSLRDVLAVPDSLPHLGRGSSTVNASAVQASSPSPSLLDYATTKAGIVNFTRGLAQMVAEDGIRANSVAPGPIWTPLIPATMPEEKLESFGEQTPMGRVGQPAEVATTFVFLASAEASYITGEVLAVTGGQPVPV